MINEMTPAKKMQAALSKCGLPAKEIQCYGRQIVVTAFSSDSAAKWSALIGKFAKVRGVIPSIDYVKKPTKGTCLNRQATKVWVVFAAIQ